MSAPWETVARILDGYRRNLAGFDETVELLERTVRSLPLDKQEEFFTLLSTHLYDEPFSYTKAEHTSHEVIVRAWARFGPAGQLPSILFAMLSWKDPEGMESWARKIVPEFAHSLWQFRERFPKPALVMIKAQCALFTYDDSSGLLTSRFPQALVDAAKRLERITEKIEFERFEQTLPRIEDSDKRNEEGLRGLLYSHGLNLQIAEAVEKARDYLQTDDPFNAKTAGDLLRACIDEAHRGMLFEVGKCTGRSYVGRDRDGDRRAYLREVGFITHAEEKFFSSTYSLISEEATHKLDVPRETMLFIEQIVTAYLFLLLRRLSEWRRRLE